MTLLRILRYGFHLLYHQLAWTYDAVAALVSAGRWVEWVRSTETHLEGCERILEIGHGPGHLMESLLKCKKLVIGVDLSPQMGRRARQKLIFVTPAPQLVRADARSLPFSAASFDAVVATFPAEYIAEPETWISFRRMLRTGGRIVVLLGARPGGYHPLNLLSNLLFTITSRIGEAEILRARAQFLEAFDRIGLDWTYIKGSVGNGETYTIIAYPKTPEDAQAAPAV